MRISIVVFLALAASIGAPACAKLVSLPPQATVAEVEPSGRAAKPPDCDMPILRREPLTDYRKVAIIEGLGRRFATEDEVMPVVRRRACETGADAIIIAISRAQTSESMTGYYINAVAIVYGKRNPAAAGPAQQFLH